MKDRKMRLSKDKLRFLETWKEEKQDHFQELLTHVEQERTMHNHTHSIDPQTHDIFFTGLTLLPLDVAKRILSECTFFTCYLSDYDPAHFLSKVGISGKHVVIMLFPHGESIPKYWSYLLHQIAHYILGHFESTPGSETGSQEEAEATELACTWVRQSPYLVPRDNFEHCSCPRGTIQFCKALATSD